MNLRYEILPPSKEFSGFINYYKYIEGFSQGTFKIVPAINQELYFHLNAGNYIFYSPGYYQIKHPLIHMVYLIRPELIINHAFDRSDFHLRKL